MTDSIDDKHGTSDEYNDPFFDPCLTESPSKMADSLDGKHGTSDEHNDPFCDPCFEGKGLNVKVHGYCKVCFQFLCSDCYIIHRKLRVSRRHVILQGGSMPQSQADKPPKFEYCDRHPILVKDKFCSAHKTLVCSSCAAEHRICIIETVADVCETVNCSETDLLYDAIKNLHDQGKSVLSSVQANIKKARGQKKQMLKEAQELHDKVISTVNKLFQEMQSEIEAAYQSQVLVMNQHRERLNDLVSRLDSSLNDIEKLRGKPIDTKMFLKIQESVTDTNQITGELRSLNESLLFADLSFIPSKTIKDILSTTFTLGSVSKSDTKPGTNIVFSEILFPGSAHVRTLLPQQSSQQNLGATGTDTRPSVPLKRFKVVKKDTYKVKVKGDKQNCYISGLAILENGRKMVVDHGNANVKMFSHDMKFLSSVSVPDIPRDIAVISDNEAVVTTYNKSLVILDISGRQLSIKITTQLSYDVYGISRYNNKFVVTSPDNSPPSVKLIDQRGRVYWSLSSDQQGQPLFSGPLYLSSPGDGSSITLIVTEPNNHALTLLNGGTGEVITRRQLTGKDPRGVTTDSAGNVYACYYGTSEVAVLSGDLSEEKILLSTQNGLSGYPYAIAYDETIQRLIISNIFRDTLNFYKLS